MKEILNEEGTPLQGESSGGILWSKDDLFARVMGPERSGHVRGVGFGQTPSGRSGTTISQYISTPPPSNETTQRITQLEIAFASMKEQLAQLDARHEEQLAQLEARHQKELTQFNAMLQEELAQFNARLQEKLAQLDARLQEQMREMLSQFSPHMHLFQDDDDFED